MRSLRTPTRSPRSGLIALLAVTLLVVAGCGSDDDDGEESTGTTDEASEATEPAPTGDTLDGRVLVVTSVTEGGEDRPLVDDTEIRLTFIDGRISATAGCNTISVGYTAADGALVTDGEVATTMAGCDQPLADQDAWLGEVLARGAEVEETDGEVTLTFGDAVLVLTDVADAELVDTVWTVDSLIEGSGSDGTASSVEGEIGATLTLVDDGTFAVATGCNTGGGDYELDDDAGTITFGPMRLTRAACPDDARQAVETAMVAVLDGEATYEVRDLSLVLTKGETGVGFRAA